MYRIGEEDSSKFSAVDRKPQKLQYAAQESHPLPKWAQWLIALAIGSMLILFVLYLIHVSNVR